MYKGPSETAGNLRNGIIARTTPRVASQDTPYCQSQPLERSMLPYGLPGIFRAGWLKAA